MSASTPPRLDVACLCAAWCRLCEGYEAVFRSAVARVQALQPGIVLHWIDIEDEADLLDELEIATFPTLLIADAQHLRFAGPVEPQAGTLDRLLRQALEPGPAAPAAAGFEALARRLRSRG